MWVLFAYHPMIPLARFATREYISISERTLWAFARMSCFAVRTFWNRHSSPVRSLPKPCRSRSGLCRNPSSFLLSKAPLCKGGWQKSVIFDWGIVTYRYNTIPPSALRAATSLYTREALGCCVQHIFDKDAVSGGGVVYQHMGHRTYQAAVLYDRRAGHECVKQGTAKKLCISPEMQSFLYILISVPAPL